MFLTGSKLSVLPCGAAGAEAVALLRTLGAQVDEPIAAGLDADQRWAASGLMSLSGAANGPPQPCPAPLAASAQGVLAAWHAAFGPGPLDALDGAQLCAERAALMTLERRGTIAAGGTCRLLQVDDGWLAVNLARDEDDAALPAWLEDDSVTVATLPERVRLRSLAELIERGRLLGLAVAAATRPAIPTQWFECRLRGTPTAPSAAALRVLDLSTLWAGPLCTHLLQLDGAEVVKVESVTRPDGARRGNSTFFDLLNHGKRSVALDLADAEGRADLRALIAQADVVVESARPRALRQLGINAEDYVARQPGLIWLAINAHGRHGDSENWIGYGDDAGIAGGLGALTLDDGGGLRFCGDAIADPLAGLHAALLVRAALAAGGGALLSVSLSGVVAWCARNALRLTTADLRLWHAQAVRLPAAAPRARSSRGPAAALGADTAAVLNDWLQRAC